MLRQMWLIGGFCGCLLAFSAVALAQTQAEDSPREGRITNLDTKPFKFRLSRASGAAWTDEFVLAPRASLVIRVGRPGDLHELDGITGNGRGHVVMEYLELGGRVRLSLPATASSSGKLQPNWYHVKDANGFSRLVQAADESAAQERQKSLQAETPLTEAEIARTKQMLRANWVLFD